MKKFKNKKINKDEKYYALLSNVPSLEELLFVINCEVNNRRYLF